MPRNKSQNKSVFIYLYFLIDDTKKKHLQLIEISFWNCRTLSEAT